MYFKISEVMRVGTDGAPLTEPAVYKAGLDYLMDIFGEDRVVFGSDWPNGNAVGHLDAIVKIARDYFARKPAWCKRSTSGGIPFRAIQVDQAGAGPTATIRRVTPTAIRSPAFSLRWAHSYAATQSAARRHETAIQAS